LSAALAEEIVAAPPPTKPVFAGRTRSGAFEVYDRIECVGPERWRAFFEPHWKDYRYYQTLEETFAREFPQRYLVLRDAAGAVQTIQPLFFAEQDLTAGLGPKWRAALRPMRRWLRLRLMMVGCIVGDGQTGLRKASDLPGAVTALNEALELYARSERVSIILFKDFPVRVRGGFAALTRQGQYTRLPSLPAVNLKLDFATFEDYFQCRLGKATRKSLRRKFKEVEASEPIALEVKTALEEPEATELHRLYERVARRGDVHFEVFTKEYFLTLGRRMPEQARYFIWRQSGRIIAFSFCTVFGGGIYDNDLGMDEALASALHLYHVTFRDIVRWALANGLTHYHSSPFNYDPKLRLRMELTPLDLYARHVSPWANALLRRFAPLLAPTRQEPLLSQFPNGAQIWGD
jgi:hypothetical protein